MPEIAVTKADVIRAIETERDWWRVVFDLAAEPAPVTGDEPINGDWTYREMIGHINGWRRWTVARLESAANASVPLLHPWPDEMTEETEAGTDEINAWFKEQSVDQSLDAAIAETFTLLDRMRSAAEAMSDERLLTPGACVDVDPELAEFPIGPALVGYSMAHCHQEHAPDLEAWLADRIGRHSDLPPTPSNLGFDD
jgi:hypothetical protein